MIVAGVTSAGGLTALAVKLSQRKNPGQEVTAGHDRRVGLAGIAHEVQ
jgi:hypothetical protein